MITCLGVFGSSGSRARISVSRSSPPQLRAGCGGGKQSTTWAPGTGGGNETTVSSFHTTLLHHGLVIVGLPYAIPETMDVSAVKGGSPLGAGTIAGADGSRQPSETELKTARFQGKHVAGIAAKLKA